MIRKSRRLSSVPAIGLLAACAAPPVAAPSIDIPGFAADDPRVGTAGFVAHTLRLHEDVEGVRYTLMAFAVGDALTLGAMVKGPFAGAVAWRIGARRVEMAFDSANAGATTSAAVDGGEPLAVQGAAFRGTAWVNVDVPRSAWLPDGTPLALEFRSPDGAVLTLPGGGAPRCARVVPAP